MNTTITLENGLNKVENLMGKSFSDEQRKIITHYGKPLNVIACAGAGKTTVSIAHMLMLELVHKVKPSEILSITFSKKASDEISERYMLSRRKLGQTNYKPTFKTFHALFKMLLEELPYYRGYRVAMANEFKFDLFKVVKSDGYRDKGDIFDTYMNVRSALINKGISPDGVSGFSTEMLADNLNVDNYIEVIEAYNELKGAKQSFDFDDMQVLLLQALENGEDELVTKFQSMYSHIILDEYQDISPIQESILNQLLSNKQIKGLMAIGDDDQAIYGFRGSAPQYIINFVYNYPSARRYFLSTNYRCKSNILDEVKPCVSSNRMRVDKPLNTFADGGKVTYLDTDTEEGAETFNKMLLDDLSGNINVSDIAVLVRFNNQRVILADLLAEQGIPVDVKDERYLLSNNTTYKVLTEVIKMVKENNGYLFKRHYFKFGKHIRKEHVAIYSSRKDTNWYMDAMEGKFGYSQKKLSLLREMHETTNAYDLILLAWKLTRDYYKELGKKGFVNLGFVVSVVYHMLNLTLDVEGNPTISFSTFERAESYKRSKLIDFIDSPSTFNIHTMHSVKGLEYRKVYLYGLSEGMVSKEDLLESYAKDALMEAANNGMMDEADSLDIISSISDYSSNVQEERRVFYVACTRAEEELVLCYNGKNPLALLDEMKTYNN